MDCLNCEDRIAEVGGLCLECHKAMAECELEGEESDDRDIEDIVRSTGGTI